MCINTIDTNNYAVITGRVASELQYSHEVFGENFYLMNIEVSRLSHVSDFLPVTISDRLIDRSILSIGEMVHIEGQIRSYNNFSEEDKRNKLVLTIFARELFLVESGQEYNPNEIFLNGFICKPPVYRTTPFGREICDMLLAVNRSYSKSDYIPCIAWGRNARFAGKQNVGDNILVWGRMQSRIYQKKLSEDEIIDKVAYEVSISKIDDNKGESVAEESI